MTLSDQYNRRFERVLVPLAAMIQDEIRSWVEYEPRIDRISARAKSVERFLTKANKKDGETPKYSDPINEIQDQVGARVVVYYETDVERIAQAVSKYLRPIEFKSMSPESEWTFGYFGRHFIFLTPTHLLQDSRFSGESVPNYFEVQIKTLFQHAWSEANHDLGYKPGEVELNPEDERHLAFASAQAWGADKTFSGLFERRCQEK